MPDTTKNMCKELLQGTAVAPSHMYLFPLGIKCFIGTTGKVYSLQSSNNPTFLNRSLRVPVGGAGILTTKTQKHEEKGNLCLRVFVVQFLASENDGKIVLWCQTILSSGPS